MFGICISQHVACRPELGPTIRWYLGYDVKMINGKEGSHLDLPASKEKFSDQTIPMVCEFGAGKSRYEATTKTWFQERLLNKTRFTH